MSGDRDDKRRFVRRDCLKVGHVISFDDVEGFSIKRSVALTKNMSAGGMLFTDTISYAVGDIVLLAVEPGSLDNNDLCGVIKTHGYVLGKIVRATQSDDEVTHCYGVSFVTVEEDESYLDIFQELLNRIEFTE